MLRLVQTFTPLPYGLKFKDRGELVKEYAAVTAILTSDEYRQSTPKYLPRDIDPLVDPRFVRPCLCGSVPQIELSQNLRPPLKDRTYGFSFNAWFLNCHCGSRLAPDCCKPRLKVAWARSSLATPFTLHDFPLFHFEDTIHIEGYLESIRRDIQLRLMQLYILSQVSAEVGVPDPGIARISRLLSFAYWAEYAIDLRNTILLPSRGPLPSVVREPYRMMFKRS